MIDGNFTLNGWLVEIGLGRISRASKRFHLEPQVMKVLVYLASHPQEVITKEKLIGELWPDTIVGDAALARCISQIRQALGDDPRKPKFVETVPKIGYRLIAQIGDAKRTRNRSNRRRWFIAAVAILLLAALSLFDGIARQAEMPIMSAAAEEAYINGLRLYEKQTNVHNQNAIVFLERALELNPEHGLAHARLADALTRQAMYWGGDRINEAQGLAERAVELAPEHAESYKALGMALALTGDPSAAIRAYGRALEVDPDHWPTLLASASLYLQQHEFEKAEALFMETLRQVPDHDVAMSRLGYLYLKTGNVEAARIWLNRALQRIPLQAQAASRLAMLEMFTGYPHEAVARCGRITEPFPRHYACLQVMAVGSFMRGDLPQALRHFESVVEHFPDDRYARLGQAKVLLAESRVDEAMQLVDWVLENTLRKIDDGDGESYDYWLIAACHTLRGDDPVAFEWLDKAANAGRRFYLWDANDPLFSTLRGDQRFDRYIAATTARLVTE